MRSFVKEYFDGKPLEELKKTITPDWSEANVERHLALLDVPEGAKKILEIGCGLGRLLVPLYDRGAEHCVGVDASQNMIAAGKVLIGKRKIDLLLCDGEGQIPFPASELRGYFDFAFSIITFQHIPNTAAVAKYLGEAYRLLRPGGQLVFQVLAADLQPGRELWTYHEPRVLQAHLFKIGFIAVRIQKRNQWLIFRAHK
jgi:SAM-dependent methyltransferase